MMKSLLKYAYPILISRVSNVMLGIVTTIIISYLGINSMSAYGLANPIYIMVYLISISYLLVFTIRASKLKSDRVKLGNYLLSSLIFSLMLSAIVIAILSIVPSVLEFLGQSHSISQLAGQFFDYITLGIPALLCSVILNQLIVVLGRSIFITTVSVIQFIFGVVLVYFFAHTCGLGIKGAAIGLAISYWLKFIIILAYLLIFCRSHISFKWMGKNEFASHCRFLLKLGWPVSLQYGSELVVASIAALIIGHLYPHALAAQQASIQIRVLFIMLAFALSQSSVILIAHQKSDISLKIQYANQVLKLAIIFGLVVTVVSMIFINVFSHWYISLFIHNQSKNIIQITEIFILITSIALVFDMIKYIIAGALRGLENTIIAMKISLATYCLFGIVFAYVFGYYTVLGVVGVRVGMLVALIMNIIVLAIYYLKHTRQLINHAKR